VKQLILKIDSKLSKNTNQRKTFFRSNSIKNIASSKGNKIRFQK